VPHPLRFSKGGNLERLRDEMFSESAFLFQGPVDLFGRVLRKLGCREPGKQHKES
jgi:hypothetical protein